MRLIDADALTEEIKSLQVHVTGLRAGKGILAKYAKQYKESVLRIIDEQPTAREVEKVEKENNELKFRCMVFSMGTMCFSCPMECEYRTMKFRGNVNERD